MIVTMDLENQIQAVLFYKAEPVTIAFLVKLFSLSEAEIRSALQTLRSRLAGSGLQLTENDSEVQLVTAAAVSHIVEKVRKDELCGDIGRAGAETLAIILYRGPISRIEIDRIRGVNSAFIVRNLLIRGLVERRPHPTDSRSFVYAITPSLLNHLGISQREELPDFSNIMSALDSFESASKTEETSSFTQDIPS
jgi:segregation and condensation protein B